MPHDKQPNQNRIKPPEEPKMNDREYRAKLHKLIFQRYNKELTSMQIIIMAEDLLTATRNRAKIFKQHKQGNYTN